MLLICVRQINVNLLKPDDARIQSVNRVMITAGNAF